MQRFLYSDWLYNMRIEKISWKKFRLKQQIKYKILKKIHNKKDFFINKLISLIIDNNNKKIIVCCSYYVNEILKIYGMKININKFNVINVNY